MSGWTLVAVVACWVGAFTAGGFYGWQAGFRAGQHSTRRNPW